MGKRGRRMHIWDAEEGCRAGYAHRISSLSLLIGDVDLYIGVHISSRSTVHSEGCL